MVSIILNLAIAGSLLASNLKGHPEQKGLATYYSVRSNGGIKTASGIPLSDHKLTAAHKTLPFGSVVSVTDIKTKKSVQVVITDRGPYVKNRIIDLSLAAAKKLAITKTGVVQVRMKIIRVPVAKPAAKALAKPKKAIKPKP